MSTTSDRFMAVPFTDGWKVLDMKVGRYTRRYDTPRQAESYCRRKNGPKARVYRFCGDCGSAPCECGTRRPA